jgi:hypothetical protein
MKVDGRGGGTAPEFLTSGQLHTHVAQAQAKRPEQPNDTRL